MPNYCSFEMKVTGSEKNVKEFFETVSGDSCNKPHFPRVFEAEICEKGHTDDGYMICIWGYCAWSVYSCMLDGDGTYNNKANPEDKTTLQSESKRLNINVEVWSNESETYFIEHYLYKTGAEIINEEIDYTKQVEEWSNETDENGQPEEWTLTHENYLDEVCENYGNWQI